VTEFPIRQIHYCDSMKNLVKLLSLATKYRKLCKVEEENVYTFLTVVIIG
jgi:hypothetical protein